MSAKIITTNFKEIEDYELFHIFKSYQLVHLGTTTDPVNLKIVIKGARVKYLPEKYSKLTVELPREGVELLTKFQNLFKEDIQAQDFLKENTMSLKLDPEMKVKTKNLKVRDCLDIAIEFGGIWNLNKLHYASWKLLDYKEGTVTKEIINYFE